MEPLTPDPEQAGFHTARQASLFDDYDRLRDETVGVLDGLLARTNQYRSSHAFADLLRFVARLPNVAPFNAALLHAQNPGIRYVASEKRWHDHFRRSVRADARAYIILIPFGPVQFVYDVAETESERPGPDQLPDEMLDPFATRGPFDSGLWYRTTSHCAPESISVDEIHGLGAGLAGDIRRLAPSPAAPLYRVRINAAHDLKARYATLAHELGHLFAGHLGNDDQAWWPSRTQLNQRAEELEAEAIAYLVCHRAGLQTTSERYLAGYVGEDAFEMPDLSLDVVIQATSYVESMGRSNFRSRRKTKQA